MTGLPPNQGNQGNLDTIRENQEKNIDLMKNQGKSGNFLIMQFLFLCF